MIAFLLAPLYLLGCYYIFRHSIRWMQACSGICHSRPFKIAYVTIFALLAFSPVIAFVLPYSQFHRYVQIASNFWTGLFFYALMSVFLVDFVIFMLRKFKFIPGKTFDSKFNHAFIGGVITICIIVLCVYGLIHSKDIQENHYQATVDKQCEEIESLNVVLIADLHLGYNTGLSQVNKMRDIVNGMDADLICIAGDIFNNDYDAIKDPDKIIASLKSMKSTYGCYAVYGNHDVAEPILSGFTFPGSDAQTAGDSRMDAFLEAADIKLLSDESVLIDEAFYLAGRPDAQKPEKTAAERKTAKELVKKMDKSKPIIVIDHEPSELEELAAAGVDVALSGHTHDGQFFPLTLSSRIQWDNSAGLLEVDGMTSIVTSGVGVYGPDMRIGSQSEVVKIKIEFSDK